MIFHFDWIAVWITRCPYFFPTALKVLLYYKDYSELTVLLFNYPLQLLSAFPVSDYQLSRCKREPIY